MMPCPACGEHMVPGEPLDYFEAVREREARYTKWICDQMDSEGTDFMMGPGNP